MADGDGIEIYALTPDRWDDLVRLFGDRGAADGCWCTWFRQTANEYSANRGAANRAILEGIVAAGSVPGLIAYVDGEPAGWCAVQPRDAYPRLNRSPVTKPVDDRAAWGVTCFFTGRRFRGCGLALALLKAAVAHALENGAEVVEGYPVDPVGGGQIDDGDGYHGFVTTFRQAGFQEVLRRKEARPIMRFMAAKAT